MPLAKSLKFRFRDRLGKAFVYTRVNRGDALRRNPEELGQVLGGTPGDGDNCRGAAQAAHSKRAVIDAPGTSQNFLRMPEVLTRSRRVRTSGIRKKARSCSVTTLEQARGKNSGSTLAGECST